MFYWTLKHIRGAAGDGEERTTPVTLAWAVECVFSSVTLTYRRQMGLFSSRTSEMTLQSVEQLRRRDLLNISALGHFPWPLRDTQNTWSYSGYLLTQTTLLLHHPTFSKAIIWSRLSSHTWEHVCAREWVSWVWKHQSSVLLTHTLSNVTSERYLKPSVSHHSSCSGTHVPQTRNISRTTF